MKASRFDFHYPSHRSVRQFRRGGHSWIALVVSLVFPVVLAVGVPPAAGAPDLAPIQPGARWGGGHGCTLNFVFRDAADRLYIGTAGHCTEEVGEEVRLYWDQSRVGEVVFRSRVTITQNLLDDSSLGRDVDFALIAIDEERYRDVDPAVRQWGGPVGVMDPSEVALGDVIAVYGNGDATRDTSQLGRQGLVIDHDERTFEFAMPISGGDSGSPIVHARTGKALGHIHDVRIAPKLSRTLEVLAEAGFDLELVTAPLPHEDIPDGRDCNNQSAPLVRHHYQSLENPAEADPSNADRLAVCVHLNGNPLLYVGGELQAEEQPGELGTCGSIRILSFGVGDPDWHNPGPDGEWGTDDDRTCQ